ncbi:MAG: DUF1292 domain-containing protein [Clostridiales bacterium]|nr:DUF1292 domain-containing protein [Clostridiales bacterium]
MSDYFSDEILSVTDENGSEILFRVVDRYEDDRGEYISVLPDEIPQAIMLAGRIEPEIYKIAFSDDGDSWLEPIEDEDEYRDVEQIFYRREEAREWDEETESEE